MSDRIQNIGARIDRLPVTKAQLGMLVLLAIFSGLDVGDISTFSYAAPGLIKSWHITVGTVGQVTSITFLGLFLGAWIGGGLGDMIGRRKMIFLSVLVFSVFSLLNCVVGNVGELELMRCLTGVGLGGTLVATWAYMAEIFPNQSRGRYQSLMFFFGLAGIPVVSIWARIVVPTSDAGWRLVFIFGAVGLITLFFIPKYITESPRWLDSKGRIAEADSLLSTIEQKIENYTGSKLEPVQSQPVKETAKITLWSLFGKGTLVQTIAVSIGMILTIVGFYAFGAWVPTLLVKAGFGEIHSLTYSWVISIGEPFGALLAWPFTDKFNRKNTLLVSSILIAICIILYGLKLNVASVLVFGFCSGVLLQTNVTFFYSYASEVFPTQIRATGWGFVNGLGRLANIFCGVLIASVYTHFGYLSIFIFVAACFIIQGVIVALLGKRTAKLSLEGIATQESGVQA